MHLRSRRSAFGAVLLSLVMAATSAAAAPAASEAPRSGAAVEDPVDDATESQTGGGTGDEVEVTNNPAEDPAVESLRRDYGLSTAQAIEQMDAQVAAGRATREMPPGLAKVFSDREIHHDQGGRVVVALTSRRHAGAMVEHFNDYGVGDVETRIVARTDRQLDALARALQQRIVASRRGQGVPQMEVDRGALGKVTVSFVDGPMNTVERDVLAQARSTRDAFAVSEVDHIDVGVKDACDRTGNIECDPPLRGSVWIQNKSTNGVCSAGFNARSRSDNKPYVLTAGHCRAGSSATWKTQFANESNHDIGPFHKYQNNTEADAGILRVKNPSGWEFGRPWITVNPNHGGHTANDKYVIRDVMSPWRGDRVCVTAGNYPGTTCGVVTKTAVWGNGTYGLFKTSEDLCLMGGDSGSPYFSHGVAYGIHISSPGGRSCGEWGKAEQAREASSVMNVRILEK